MREPALPAAQGPGHRPSPRHRHRNRHIPRWLTWSLGALGALVLLLAVLAVLARLQPLTEHLVGKLLERSEMSLSEALVEIRNFEAG